MIIRRFVSILTNADRLCFQYFSQQLQSNSYCLIRSQNDQLFLPLPHIAITIINITLQSSGFSFK